MTIEGDLALAHELADAADGVTLPRFRAADLRVDTKSDSTPVSDADTEAERVIRRLVAQHRPGDAVVGEEYGDAGTGSRRWIIDPIDGTKNFVGGVPVWASLIALEVEGNTAVGVVSAPALGRRWWAGRGLGAHAGTSLHDARRITVSTTSDLGAAFLSYSSLPGWERQGRLPGLLAVALRAARTRAFGDFWSHVLVAEGVVDASFEPEVSLWDLAALQVIVEEAGGRFSDLSGVERPDGGSALCSNGLLHEQLLRELSPGSH